MKIPRNVSGAQLADVLCQHWHYSNVHQVGSHIILETSIPAHRALRLGTLSSILRTVAEHKAVPRDAIIATL
jgi:predicted RNA binding protein YcfA (HicA-like mRNA interferase family)